MSLVFDGPSLLPSLVPSSGLACQLLLKRIQKEHTKLEKYLSKKKIMKQVNY